MLGLHPKKIMALDAKFAEQVESKERGIKISVGVDWEEEVSWRLKHWYGEPCYRGGMHYLD